MREYWKKNTDKYKQNREQRRQYDYNLRLECLIHYGGNPPKCACCGETHIEFLTIDHVYGGGNKHRQIIKSNGSYFYKWLKKNNFPKDFQVLCANCNMAKGRNKIQFCLIHHPNFI